MINWRDCIVPDIKLRNHVYVWVAYSKDYPYLPIAVADTAQKLADMTGTTKQTVISAWCHYKNGAKNRESVAHSSVCSLGYDIQRLLLHSNTLLLSHKREVGNHVGYCYAVEIINLTTRQNRRYDFVLFSCGENEYHIARRLLEGFEESVECGRR